MSCVTVPLQRRRGPMYHGQCCTVKEMAHTETHDCNNRTLEPIIALGGKNMERSSVAANLVGYHSVQIWIAPIKGRIGQTVKYFTQQTACIRERQINFGRCQGKAIGQLSTSDDQTIIDASNWLLNLKPNANTLQVVFKDVHTTYLISVGLSKAVVMAKSF